MKECVRNNINREGETHTVVTCVSTPGFSILPMIIYPRKRMTAKLTEGALPGKLFNCSDKDGLTKNFTFDGLSSSLQTSPNSTSSSNSRWPWIPHFFRCYPIGY